MTAKFKHTSQRVLAKQVLEMIDWQLEFGEQLACSAPAACGEQDWGEQLQRDQMERTEHQKMVDEMLGSLAENMGKTPSSRALNTMQVARFRDYALRAQTVSANAGSGTTKAGICSSFKRLNLQRN